MTQLGSSVTNIYSSRSKKKNFYYGYQNAKNHKIYRDDTEHSGITFQCKYCKKRFYRLELLKGAHEHFFKNLQQMESQGKHSRIY